MSPIHQPLREVFHKYLGYPGYGYLRFFAKELGKVSEDLVPADIDSIAGIAQRRLVNVLDADALQTLIAELRRIHQGAGTRGRE